MERKQLPYRLDLPASEPVRLGDLPHLIAEALHKDEFARAAAEEGIWREVCEMVDAGELQPLNPLTMGRHSFPIGDALRRAVVLPYALPALLQARGIELHLVEPGNGPTHWSLRNAARAIGEVQGWSERQTETLCRQMLEAARGGTLVVRHPHTDLPVPLPERATVRDFYELVFRDDVNAWLDSIRAPYRWVTYEQAAAEPRYIGGRRLWKLAQAVDWVTQIDGFGVSRDGLLRRAVNAASAQPPRLQLTDPEPAKHHPDHPGDALSGFLGDGVFAADFNRWLEAEGWRAPYWLPVDSPSQQSQPKQAVTVDSPPVAARPLEHWKMRIQAEAAVEWKRLRRMNCNPTRASIRPHLIRWCKANGVLTSGGINPSDGYLRTHVLSAKHWTPPD